MRDSKIFVLYTGGTIGMAPMDKDNEASPLQPKGLNELLGYMPNVARLKSVTFTYESFERPLDSSDVKPGDWIRMAKMIHDNYDGHDGFIILHGTDTMAYTASGLSFIFENLAKPVVITGSQLPISAVRTDAVLNFTNAIYLAAYKTYDLPLIAEVVICFADKILRGCRATKVSTNEWAGFDSPNYPPLGTIGEHIEIRPDLLMALPGPDKKLIINTELVEDVMNIGIFPGVKAGQFRKLLVDNDAIEGVVMNTFGAGNAPGDEEFLGVIDDAAKQGRLILNITQCLKGMVEMGLYAASSGLLERGVVSGLDMTSEAALAKLMWTLGTQFGEGRITQLQISQRGEQSQNLFDLRYGGLDRTEAKDLFTGSATPDGRLNRERLSRAVIRISSLGLDNVEIGSKVVLNAFMNMPRVRNETPSSEDRCVATFEIIWRGVQETQIKVVTDRVRHVIGSGQIILSLVSPDPDVRFYYQGLYLALFSAA